MNEWMNLINVTIAKWNPVIEYFPKTITYLTLVHSGLSGLLFG